MALNSARFNLTRVIGPAIAGVLLAAYGAGVCLAVAAISSLGVIGSILAIRLPFEPRPAPLDGLTEGGLGYCWRDKAVRRLLLVTSVVGFLIMPYQTFLPALAAMCSARPGGLGLLLTSVGAGAIAEAAVSGNRLAARRPDPLMMGFMVTTGIALAVLSTSANWGSPWSSWR